MNIKVSLEGFEQLDRRFGRLSAVGKFQVLSEVLSERAEMVRAGASQRAPRRSGRLAAGIQVKLLSQSDISQASFQVGTGRRQYYGRMQEFGTGRGFNAAAARALGFAGQSRSNRTNNTAKLFFTETLKSTEVTGVAAIESALKRHISQAENS